MARLYVVNADEVIAEFGKLGQDMQRKALAAMASAAAEVVRRRASELAPRMSGDLAKNILAGQVKNEDRRVVVNVGPGKKEFYGMFQELGTKHSAAQPFLRPAIDEGKNEAVNAARAAGRSAMGW